ncbi:hypothetical protein Y032_0273g992 [Ancylostoma ceylanicum]|uniref:Peptidase M12A domain-containing protein n=1 Tax=Ancylostoma ceylanicum TaxID=53326 RepID=A0A016S7Z5_9BILA|nr:hypothetical protein Y032_0273g992 [Ancylostoma ceylanicum]
MSRNDRDEYIVVDTINKPNYANQFKKNGSFESYGLGYDYGSIMHYLRRSGFSKDDYVMIIPDSKYINTLGSEMISFIDLTMINKHYNCTEKCKSESSDLQCQHGGYPHPRNCSICLCPTGYGGVHCNERPSDGCGKELEAKNTWQEETITISGDSKEHLDGYKKCNYWIKSPKDTKIKIELKELRFNATAGCSKGGVEVKTKKDQTLTGYRFCDELEEDLPLSSTLNLVPLIIYSRPHSDSRAVVRYRYGQSSNYQFLR